MMADEVGDLKEFDLVPDPRVLQMLGEISLAPWRCLGELTDNSIDGFMSAKRAGNPVVEPEVRITIPTSDARGAMVRVRDNGPGMTPDVLEKAVRAGWTSNNPIDNLGLFGMGFNIATARLATTTQVWTTRADDLEWSGLEIDFNTLRKQGHYLTPRLSRPKEDASVHGTEIVLTNLKEEQLAWLAKSANRSNMKRQLSKVYASMLRENGDPLTVSLHLNGHKLQPHRHCIWSEERTVHVANLGDVAAVIEIDSPLPARHYCSHCMSWRQDAKPCAACPTPANIELRGRRIRGWIGLQRYLDGRDYGIDFIRNGRKIELQNRDLFVWLDDDGEEVEYPIDDQRGRGRFVGEIHLDHGRVSYSKDRFERSDPAWAEMVHIVRGAAPLRPNIATDRGYGDNDSPLAKLFKAFRRTSPSSNSSGWSRILCVKENDRAKEMARRFHDGEPDYREDTKWWELVEEQDNEILRGGAGGGGTPPPPSIPPGIDGDDSEDGAGAETSGADGEADTGHSGNDSGTTTPPAQIVRTPIAYLSREYRHASSNHKFTIDAREAAPNDPKLKDGLPWVLEMADTANRVHGFIVNPHHALFWSMTMTPLDALLAELAHATADYWRSVSGQDWTFADILAEYRRDYAGSTALDAATVAGEARRLLEDIAQGLVANCPEGDRGSLYDDLSQSMKSEVLKALAAQGVTKVAETQADGGFLRVAPGEVLRTVADDKLYLLMDGRFWDRPLEALEYGDADINENVRAEARNRVMNLLDDVIWASEIGGSGGADASRAEMTRARMSTELLQPATDLQ